MRKRTNVGLVYLNDNDIKRNPFVKVCKRDERSSKKKEKEFTARC
jgi:hypothetical protein